ncbi:hypothetical protein Hypma_002809 [Hypsizygus marmoreus]|uniref:MYND-type domain-containing protein n=1 Tax=Hypsizygus marmoreus TaxID=39966 RepID=A0A369JAX4_HYPMA|nr:hypothetical protein Hypma_002809 [Hypsizygus marmoreus]
MSIDFTSTEPLTSNQRVLLQQQEAQQKQAAQIARATGDTRTALTAYFKLIPIQDRLYSIDSLQVAESFAEAGLLLMESGRPDAAEEAYMQVLKVRDDARWGGLGMGERRDAVAAREWMGKAKEGLGKYVEAREVRMRGKDDDVVLCSSSECSKDPLKLSELNQCGGCRCRFYCSTSCQKSDWRRHKRFCQEHGARAKAQINIAGI